MASGQPDDERDDGVEMTTGTGNSRGSGPGGAGGRSRGGKVRVKTAKRRTNSSNRWLERQLNDPYVIAAKAAGYRSRAAFKLKELDEQFGLLGQVERVVDLGAAPGGWCQIVLEKRPRAQIVAIDLLPIDAIVGVTIFEKDILDDDTEDLLLQALGGKADLVLSDMAANTVGHQATDHLRTMGLIEAGLDMATRLLRPGGNFVAKVLAGGGDGALTGALKKAFSTVKHVKPPASRKGSSEWYVVAQGFKGLAEPEV
jgi:23S rRNA (uridine2552-2'-O)-methyltransferase